MNRFDKVKIGGRVLLNSIFYGMKGGDNALNEKSSLGHDSSIDNHVIQDGVFNDFLNGQETERVQEIRDEYYRILKEADKYHVDVNLTVDDNGGIIGETISASSRKKTASDYSKHCNVYNEEGLKVRVIQDNKHIEKDSVETNLNINVAPDIWDYETTLNVNWGDITPRFQINKFVTKIVVREYNNTEAIIDLYFPTIPGQFTKLDALMVNELNRLFKDGMYRSEIKEVRGLSFITDKAWNSESLCQFSYSDLKYNGIVVYDGSFVVSYKGTIVDDGVSVTEKFELDTVNEKYENKLPKEEATDLFAINKTLGDINFSFNK